MSKLRSPEQLRKMYPAPKERALGKVIRQLDQHCTRFIELSPFCVVASADARGRPDVSPRGGAAGFVKVLDAHTLIVPDRPGNNRLDTLSNLISHPAVAVLFFVPGVDETLRVFGQAEVHARSDTEMDIADTYTEAKVLVRITIHQAYFQCAKALMRARLWETGAQIERTQFPALGLILKDQMQLEGPAETQEEMLGRYQKDL